MSSKPTKRSHYLPQSYLRPFLTYDVFWVYYKGKNEPIAQTPINTGVKNNIYNFKKPDGSIDDSLEKVLSGIENDYKMISDKLLQPKSRLDSSDIEKLAIFFSFIATRVPRSIELSREIYKELVIHRLKKLSKKREEIERAIEHLKLMEDDVILSVDQFEEFCKDPEKNYRLSVNKTLAMASSIELSRDIYLQLMDMNWCLCRSQSDILYVTSDAPLVPLASRYDGLPQIGVGYGLRDVEVTMPISPTLCIHMSRKPLQKYRAVNKDFVKEINRRTSWNAEKMIISSIRSNNVYKLNSWASNSLTQPKIDRNWFRHMLEFSDV
ncbi:MAG: DUF4238 domain-containing protein [Thermodesulfobacteriota bacterium]